MSKTIEEILAPKPEAKPRIYAYTIHNPVSSSGIRPPLRGWWFLLLRVTRALPWANTGRPFGALAANSANGATQPQPRATPWVAGPGSANGATQPQPRATPWVTHPQHPFSPERATQLRIHARTIHNAVTNSANGATQPQPTATPWVTWNATSWRMTRNMCGIRPPLRGWWFLFVLVPRALPWAVVECPFGALAANSANGATHAQPRATPWVAHPQPPFSPEGATRPCIHAHTIHDPASGSANGATQPQPRATPWVVGSQHPFSPEGAT